MPEKEHREQQDIGEPSNAPDRESARGTLGEAISPDVENVMREQAGSNQEKINAILEDALRVYEEAKKTGLIHQAIDKADEFMDSAARGAGIGTERLIELFTKKIPPEELDAASQEVAAGERAADVPVPPPDVVKEPAGPRPETRPRTESEISQEEKDAIVQDTLSVFKEGLGTSSVSAAEEAARNKFKEIAGRFDEPTYEALRQRVTQEINALEAEERRRMLETKPAPAGQENQEQEDTTALREQAQKLGIAFSDQATAEDIKRRLQERSEFENKQPAPETTPRIENKPVAGSELEENKAEPEKNETETVKDQLRDSQGQISEFLLKNPDLPETDQDQLSQALAQLKKLGEERSAADAGGRWRWLERSWDAMENASRIMSKNEPGRTVIDRETASRFYQSPENLPTSGVEGTVLPTPEVETPTPPLVDVGVKTLKPLPSSELTAEELEAVFTVAKVENIKDVENLPEAVKEKLDAGFWGLNFTVKKWASENIAEAISAGGKRVEKKSAVGRLLEAASDSYKNEAEDAQQKLDKIAEEKTSGKLADQRYLVSSLMRYGRTASDFLGWTTASPLKFITLGAMAVGRSADILKEARLKNEEVIEKTRVQDINKAADEAIKIYEAAGGVYDPTLGGDGVSKEDLTKAYQEKLPEDLLKRLHENPDPEVSSKIAQKIFRWHIEKTAGNVQRKIAKIESDSNLSKKEQEAQKQTLLNKYSKRLKDFDRIVSQYGEVDALAMAGRYTEMASKGAVYAVMGESLILGVERLWGHVAGITADNLAESREVGQHQEKLVDLYDRVLGIDSKDGLDKIEWVKISSFMGEALDKGDEEGFEKMRDLYGNMEVKGTGQTLESLIMKEATPTAESGESVGTEPVPKPELPPEPDLKAVPESAPTPEIKPGRFENIIDSSKVEGSDSVWKSTQELFMQNRRQMDYDASRDGPPSEWANKKTAELVKEYADAHGGQAPELVHNGDKVVVETGTDGKYHLKVVSSSGEEVEPRGLPHKHEHSEHADHEEIEIIKGPDDPFAPLKFGWVGAETVEIRPEVVAETKKLAREYEATPLDQRDKFVYNYIVKEVYKPEYQVLKLPHLNEEKLMAFARMFGGGDWAGISSPEKLAQNLVEFDNGLKFYTQRLVDGSLDRAFKGGGEAAFELTHNIFPIETQDGEILYAQMQKGGKWRIANSNGEPLELKRSIIRDTDLFDLKNVKKLLGY